MPIDLRPAVRLTRDSWNKGRIVGQKCPLLTRDVWSIRVRLEMAGNTRDLALFNMAIDSKLRVCDLAVLRVRDAFAAGHVKERAFMTLSKTGKPARFEITDMTRQSLECWMRDPNMIGCEFLWPSWVHGGAHLSTRQCTRLVCGWVASLGSRPIAFSLRA